MANLYSELATNIFDNEFDSNTGVVSHSQISGWLSTNVGKLNALLHTNFTGENPSIDDAAANIFYLQYMSAYNTKAARNALRGILSNSSNGDNILSVSDGDNRISFVNKKEVAKEFSAAAKELTEEINKLAYNYTLYAAQPLQVVGAETFISGYSGE
jgi:hypothetical protein